MRVIVMCIVAQGNETPKAGPAEIKFRFLPIVQWAKIPWFCLILNLHFWKI